MQKASVRSYLFIFCKPLRSIKFSLKPGTYEAENTLSVRMFAVKMKQIR